MVFKDFCFMHRRLLHKAKSVTHESIEDRKKIMLPVIAGFFNTISVFDRYDKLSQVEYHELNRMVKMWVDYLAYHSVIILVPILPLLGPELVLRRRNKRKMLEGVVIKQSGEKTVKVKCEYIQTHPKYKKQIRKTKNYLVHDEKGVAHVGDYVQIVECRPISKNKHFRIASVLFSSFECLHNTKSSSNGIDE